MKHQLTPPAASPSTAEVPLPSHACRKQRPANHSFSCSSLSPPMLPPPTPPECWLWGPWLPALVHMTHLWPWEHREQQSFSASMTVLLQPGGASWELVQVPGSSGAHKTGVGWLGQAGLGLCSGSPKPSCCQTLGINPPISSPPCCHQSGGLGLTHGPKRLLLDFLLPLTWQD